MWFVWLALGLGLLTVAGLYSRRRVVEAMGALGLAPRGQRAVRLAALWLLFGYPLVMFTSIAITLARGGERMATFEGPLATWLLVLPFFLTVLVVLQALPWLLVVEVVQRVRRRRGSPSWMRRGHALAVLAPVVAFAIYTPARIGWQRGELRWRHHVVELPGGDRAAGAPAPGRFRIAFVADVQEDAHTPPAAVARVVDRINALAPDLVLSGGDWINVGPAHIEAAAGSAGRLRARLGVYSVRGDHEHFAYTDRDRSVAQVTEALRGQGVAMLHNEVRRFAHDGRTIAVAFLTYSYPARTSFIEIAHLLAELAGADVRVLVTHQLTGAIAAQVEGRVDLVLAAHTHGGQVNPVVGLWHVPLARLETPYVDGRYQLGTTTIVVTAGVGYSLVPFRYASPGSIDTIDLVW
jgi:hypothetical protein